MPLSAEGSQTVDIHIETHKCCYCCAASESKFLAIITENMGPRNLRAQIKVLALQCYLLAHDPGQVNCVSLGFHPVIYQLAFV